MFRILDETIWVAPQISVDAVAAAAQGGVTLIINNRPEGESDDQTSGAEIERAVHGTGLDYIAIPVTHAGFSQSQVDAMIAALNGANGKVLAYCRSGTRSTLLWALARAAQGDAPDILTEKAIAAGYDLGPIRAMLDMLAARV